MTTLNLKALNRLFLTFTFVFSIISFPAYAQVNIAVVDVDQILVSSKAAKSIKQEVDTKRKGFIKSVKQEEDALRAAQKKIQAEHQGLSKEELAKKIQEFDRKRIEAKTAIDKKKSALDQSYSEAMNTLTKVIYEVCQEIANERSIDLVITRQNIIVGSSALDITGDVLDRMNKKLPNLSLK